jgi:hypothetical protein
MVHTRSPKSRTGSPSKRSIPWILTALFVLVLVVAGIARNTTISRAQVPPVKIDVTTYHNDNARTGLNSGETVLKPSNVTSATFGQLFSHPVDGYVYAQPLVVTNVTIAQNGVHNGIHDVVYVATEHDSVYAFDANNLDGANATPLWTVSVIPVGGTTVPNGDTGTGDIVPEIGITGTPVIDKSTKTMYLVAKTKENGNYVQRLHALDIGTGQEKFGGPIVIQASVRGTGDGSILDPMGNRVVPFDSLREHNRPALLLVNGTIAIAWASHGDNGPYHGWLMTYNASTLQQVAVYNTTPNGGLGGIWMAGAGPASDGASIFLETGNGTFDANTPGSKDYGDSFLRLNVSDLLLRDSFTPYNQNDLNIADIDVGSGGLILLPDSVGTVTHPHLLVGSSKEGRIYLLDRDNLGGFQALSDSQVVQSIPNAFGGTWSIGAYFNNTLYYNGAGDVLRAFPISNGHISAVSSTSSFTLGFPGATPAVSSNGLTNGIVWLLQTDAYGSSGPAVLRAFDASNTAVELYDSGQMPGRDTLGGSVKFAVPTVANGKVYVGTQTAISVFGLGKWVDTPVIRPNGGDFPRSALVSIADTTPGAQITYTLDGSDPTPSSKPYTGLFTLVDSTTVRARAFLVGFNASAAAQALFTLGAPGNGDGLSGAYFPAIDLTGVPVQRTDPTVDFDWGGGSPIAGIGASNWSARWTGFVQPRATGSITFSTLTDDGVRLWVNNQLIIDNWTFHGATLDQGSITLFAGTLYPIRMEFFQGGGGSLAHLFWSALGAPSQVIPQTQLYSATVAAPRIVPNGAVFQSSIQITMTEVTPVAPIYYTLDGSTPTAASRRFNGPFTLSYSAVVKAIAIKSASVKSSVASASFTRSPTAPVYAINCGGGAAAPFAADSLFDSGGTNSVSSAIDTSLVTAPAPQAVYQSERWNTKFAYLFPGLKPAASYKIRLHFAELVWNAAGKRVFNVAINGTPVLNNFDIVGTTGGQFKAVVREFTHNAAGDGTLRVQFSSVADFASCSGIEILANGMQNGRDR